MTHPARLLLDSAYAQAFARQQQAAHEAATSPWNTRKHPSPAMLRAGNYKRGPFELRPGLRVKMDNARGTVRTGTSPDGTTWANRMAADYGDILGTRGADGDAVDIFLGPFPESDKLWVINQRRTWGDRGFDEHKVMAGFHTEEQARAAYLLSYDRGWDGLESIVPCTYEQLRWWLRNGDCTARFTTENLQQGNAIMDHAVSWDKDANPVGLQMHQLVYDLRRADSGGLLLDAVTMADLMTDPDIEGLIQLDALVVEVSRMSLKMDMLKKVMEASGGKVKPTEVTISDPVRARGVLQVMVIFQMDDGQAVSVWFHNPDTTPAKLTPMDELISWKWMLNKRDVTIVVAPEYGKELNIREVARRVMRLVERNSDAFKRANARTVEREKQVQELRTEITVLESTLDDLQRKIEIKQMEADEAPTPKERWDLARGHANVVAKELREEVSNTPQAARGSDAYALALEVLKLVEQFASGEVAAGSPEALRSIVDEHAVEVRTHLAEAAKAPAPAPEVQPAAQASTVTYDAGLAELLTPDDLFGIRDDGGYLKIRDDERLALKWQDVLDSALQQRIVDVRNSLRTMGWAGAGPQLTKTIAESVYGLTYDVKQVGAGKNVVGVTWVINGVAPREDGLEQKAKDFAAFLNDEANAYASAMEANGTTPPRVPVTLPTEAEAVAHADLVTLTRQAEEAGRLDFLDGDKRIPALSKRLAEILKGSGHDGGKLLEAWLRAWDAANIAAPVVGVTEETPTADPANAAATAPPKADDVPVKTEGATGSPTDAELEAAAEAGAEVHRIAYNPAMSKAERAGMALATLKTPDGKTTIFLMTDADVGRAVRAVHDAEDMAHYKRFDPSTLKMPTAAQLGLNKPLTAILIVANDDNKVVLDGWSNGHMIDLLGRPSVVQKALEKNVGDFASGGFARRIPVSSVEKIETAAKGRATKVEPIAQYDFEEEQTDANRPAGKTPKRIPRESIVMESADGSTWVWLDERYVAYFWKTYKGCEFFADSPDASVAVRHHGKLVGIIMPRATKGDDKILLRAKRVKAKAEVANDQDTLSTAKVDAAYQFAQATDAFKIAVAHSVDETSYSAFVTARDMDVKAKALGLSIAWDVQTVVMDGVPLPGFDAAAALAMFPGGPAEALAAAARSYLPAGAVLDFAGDVSAAVAQLQIALDVCTTNEPINRAAGNVAQADLEAQNAAQFRAAIGLLTAAPTLDDAGESGGEEWETVVGTIKRGGEVIGRAVIADGDGKAMIYVGATGKQRVTYVSGVDGERRNALWSDDDAVDMLDWLVENLAFAEQQAQAAIAAAQAAAAETASEDDEDPNIGRSWRSPEGAMEVIGYDEKTRRYKTQITSDIGEQAPGMQIDPDDLEQQIRDDERAVRETEEEFARLAAEQRAREEADKAGSPELEVAGFKRIGTTGQEYGKSVQVDDVTTLRFNVKRVGAGGYPVGWVARMSATFNNGVTGAPSQELGKFESAAQAAAAVEAELEKRKPAPAPSGEDAPMETQTQDTQVAVEAQTDKLPVKFKSRYNGVNTYEVYVRRTNKDVRVEQADGGEVQIPSLYGAELTEQDKADVLASARRWIREDAAQQVADLQRMKLEVPAELYAQAGMEPPAPAAPAADPAQAADRAYLQTLIDGTADMLDPSILDRIEPMFAKYEADADMMDLLNRAAQAYSDAATEAAKQALGR